MAFYSAFLYILLFGCCCYAEQRTQILQFTPRRLDDFNAISNIQKSLHFEPDFLYKTHTLGQSGLIVLEDESSLLKAVQYFNKSGIENQVFEYVQPQLKKSMGVEYRDEQLGSVLEHHYLSYEEQMRYINTLNETSGDFVRVESIGKSFEGRDIKAVTFGYPGTNKPIFWVNAGIHAREWIGHSTAFYFIKELVSNPEWRELLRKIDIVVSPNANPDGYEYTRTVYRLWRANRKIIEAGGGCTGIDLNRNFPYEWLPQEDGSLNACEAWKRDRMVFPGIGPASEPETQALIRALEKSKDRIKGFIDVHSAGQQILYPWGYAKGKYPADVEELIAVAKEMKKAIQNERGTDYQVINSADLYPANGASDDYSKNLGIKYVYVFELSGPDRSANTIFEAPESWISPVGTEITKAFSVLAKQISKEFA